MSDQPIEMYCPKCGSTEIRKDAFAEWDPEKQDWVLHSVYDQTICDNCGEEGCDERPYTP